jgi:hypothetical protein
MGMNNARIIFFSFLIILAHVFYSKLYLTKDYSNPESL